MIQSPKDFFEQFQNFIEESGLQLKKFKSNLSNYFTKAEAIDTFLGKTDKAESAKKADEAIKATQDSEGNVISSTYLTQANASSTYLTKTGKATSASTATKATQDASGNVITATYATKAELSNKLDTSSAFTKAQADNLYLSKSAKAVSASTADNATSATKATQDASGNIITSTYATKTEVTQGLAGKANASHTHTTAQVTGLDTALAGKAPMSHTHTIANVTGLQTTLDGKADTSYVNAGLAEKQPVGNYATTEALTTGLSGKLGKTEKASSATVADTANSVAWANVTGKPSIPSAPNAYVTEFKQTGTSWYRKWSNGFIEQGDTAKLYAKDSTLHITLITPFSSNAYYVWAGFCKDYAVICYNTLTKTSFALGKDSGSPLYDIYGWYACGY